MLLKITSPDPIDDVADYIEVNALLNPHVLDIQANDEVLVVLTDGGLPSGLVEHLIKRTWHGPVEVYCASDMVIGA